MLIEVTGFFMVQGFHIFFLWDHTYFLVFVISKFGITDGVLALSYYGCSKGEVH